jgi:hypothetical protein
VSVYEGQVMRAKLWNKLYAFRALDVAILVQPFLWRCINDVYVLKMDPLKVPLYRLVNVPHCIGQLALLTLPPILWGMLGGKGKAYLFIAQIGRYIQRMWRYERCFLCPCWNIYSQHMSTLCTLWSLCDAYTVNRWVRFWLGLKHILANLSV